MPAQLLAQTQTNYVDALSLGPSEQFSSVQFFVSAPNSCLYQLAKMDKTGKAYWDEVDLVGQPGSNGYNNCYGIRFKNFGTAPTVVLCDAFFRDDPTSTGSIPSQTVLSVTGASSGGDVSIPVYSLAAWPPVTPTDGQLAILIPDPTGFNQGVRWLFQYNAASGSPYKWESVDCEPLYFENPAGIANLTNGSNNVDTVSKYPVGRDGDWKAETGCTVLGTQASLSAWGTSEYCQVMVAKNGGLVATNSNLVSPGGQQYLGANAINYFNALVAGDVLAHACYKNGSGYTFQRVNTWLKVWATRIA